MEKCEIRVPKDALDIKGIRTSEKWKNAIFANFNENDENASREQRNRGFLTPRDPENGHPEDPENPEK